MHAQHSNKDKTKHGKRLRRMDLLQTAAGQQRQSIQVDQEPTCSTPKITLICMLCKSCGFLSILRYQCSLYYDDKTTLFSCCMKRSLHVPVLPDLILLQSRTAPHVQHTCAKIENIRNRKNDSHLLCMVLCWRKAGVCKSPLGARPKCQGSPRGRSPTAVHNFPKVSSW